MIFSVLLSSALLISSASATSSSSAAASNKQELGSSESRGYSSHPSGPPPAAYEPREPEAGYSKSRYESSEQDAPAPQEDYAPKAPAKKTVILAIPVKLALQQADREKSTSSYEASGESYGNSGGSRTAYPTSYASYADQAPAAPGSSHNAPQYSSGSNSYNNNNQYELAAVVPNQNSQLNYNNQQPPAYAASSSQGYVQSSPVVYAPSRDHSERPLRTYSDKPSSPKPYQPDNDVDAPSSYSNSPSYDYSPKPRPASSYAAADDSSYEVEEHPRPRKTHKRPAAYVEESVDDESYSRPSPRPKYVTPEPDSDAYPGLDGATGYHSDLSDIGKTASASLPSYASDALDDSDYTSLGLQAYSSPSLPQSELSYLMSKMPRGFHPIPAASSYGLTDLPAPRPPRPYPFGLPSRPAARRPYLPGPYAPAPYLKSPYAGAAYPAPPPRYLPAASFRSYSSIPYYGAASSPVPASSPFRLSSAVAGGLSLGKSFGSGKGLRIGPLEFGSSGSLFPSIKIKSPVRV